MVLVEQDSTDWNSPMQARLRYRGGHRDENILLFIIDGV